MVVLMNDNIDIKFLIDILLQDKPSESIRDSENYIFKIIPELSLCKNFEQNSIWHVYDVYEHILKVIDGVDSNLVLRMAALFHDIGKPFVYDEDQNGIGHFFGHWDKSKEIFDEFAIKYNIDEKIRNEVSNLILYHDLNIDRIGDLELDSLVNTFDRNGIVMLFLLKRSDLLAQNEKYHYLLEDYRKQENKVLARGIKINGSLWYRKL